MANDVSGQRDSDPVLTRVAAIFTNERSELMESKAHAIRTGDVTSHVTPENVSRRWMTGLATA
jgi:hypothetical protein